MQRHGDASRAVPTNFGGATGQPGLLSTGICSCTRSRLAEIGHYMVDWMLKPIVAECCVRTSAGTIAVPKLPLQDAAVLRVQATWSSSHG